MDAQWVLTIVGAVAGCAYVVRQVPPFCRELIKAIRAVRLVVRELTGTPPSPDSSLQEQGEGR